MDQPVRIGPYAVLARLGLGGMAETFLAMRRGPGAFEQRVCIKRVREDLDHDPEFVRQFLAEAAIVARLRHTAIAQVLDFGRDGPDYYMALELVDGLDLRELLDALPGGLVFEQTLHLALEVTRALDFAHRGGGTPGASAVIHRDVSASNVLVSREGEIKLTDFGIARALGAPKHTRTGIVKGKIPYLAPEYARSGRFDARCDLFALGVLLYECATGERPHEGATELETLELAANGTHVPLCERRPDVPPAFGAVVERLLAPDPDARFPDAASVLAALLALSASTQPARHALGALVAQARAERASLEASAATPRVVAASATFASDSRRGVRTQPLDTPAQDDSIDLRAARSMRGRGPALALAFAAVFALSVLVFGILRTPAARSAREPERHSPPATTARHDPAENASAQPEARSGAQPASAEPLVVRPTPTVTPNPSDPTTRATRRASLEIVVIPFGEVTVDGRARGPSPLSIAVAPGSHRVEAKTPTGVLRKTVSVAAGEKRQVLLR